MRDCGEMVMSKEKKKKKAGSALGIVLFMLIGMVCGIMMAGYLGEMIKERESVGEALCILAILFVWMYVVMFLQIAVHEAGHLVFGLFSGYRFSSYRIGSFMWLKENGKITLKRFSLAGTGGQCLMIPPDMKDGKIPYVLYNLGGSLANLLLAFGSFIGYLFCDRDTLISVLFLIAMVVALGFAIVNGVPMRIGGVDNDGKNAMALGKMPEALYSFWLQLKTNEQLARGIRSKDMPEEWFRFPSDDGVRNSMAVVLGVICYNRQMDLHAFEEAKEIMEKLLLEDTALMDMQRHMLRTDGIYLELIGENNKQRVDELFDAEQKKFMKTMKRYPSVLRTEYAYALLEERDAKKAEKVKEQFEKVARTYPYSCEIELERELMELVRAKSVREDAE